MSAVDAQAAAPLASSLGEIQRLVVTSYTDRCARHLLLQVRDAAPARRFLRQLLESEALTLADDSGRGDAPGAGTKWPCRINLSLTFRGLEALGLDSRYLGAFRDRARAFSEGAWFRAANRLGDTGAAASAHWETEFGPDTAHLLLTLHGADTAALDRATQGLQKLPGASDGLNGWAVSKLDARHLDATPGNRRVHFGYRDGLTRLKIRGIAYLPSTGAIADAEHAAGEFLLGHENDAGFDPWQFPGNEPGQTLTAFFRNSSFGVLRKIEQNEAAFRGFVQQSAAQLGLDRGYVMAKLCGRWPVSGAVVSAESPGADDGTDPAAGFDFTADPKGLGCPFGAHIRRMNPRADKVVPFRRRPLMRRGMPYGKPYVEAPSDPRGLMGLFVCVSIEDQFEHLVGQWGNANPLGAPNRGNARDPFVASVTDAASVFDIPGSNSLKALEPFVLTKGTLYTFFPSLSAFKVIAGVRERSGGDGEPSVCPICGQSLHGERA